MTPTPAALLVIAKSPQPGKVKTRLTPPCTPAQAAALAAAALQDTLEVVGAAGGPRRRRVLVLDGPAVPWVPGNFGVLPQRGEGLGERLANAFGDAGGPALLIGMDTPQVDVELIEAGLHALDHDGARAVLAPAADGGYWAIGLREADPRVFAGIEMSTRWTGRDQLARLRALGLPVTDLPPLLDVDTFDDARAVAAAAPGTRFAARLATIAAGLGQAASRTPS